LSAGSTGTPFFEPRIPCQAARPTASCGSELAAFAVNLDTTIVNVALPTLVRELHASTTLS
jgi:hypothetical protein